MNTSINSIANITTWNGKPVHEMDKAEMVRVVDMLVREKMDRDQTEAAAATKRARAMVDRYRAI